MYLLEVRPILSQGDIFTQINLIDSAAPQSPPQTFDVIVISHTCEIEKPSNLVILVCAIRPLSQIDPGHRGNFQSNRVINAMYLEPIVDLPESFIDFRYIFRVNKTFLEECVRKGFKIASFNDEARLALTTFFYRFLARKTPITVAARE